MIINRTYNTYIIIVLFSIQLFGGTRAAYTRPGLMMRIPTTSNTKTPYLFRVGIATEFHNFNPFNTAGGAYFETELGRGFGLGFSAVIPGDPTQIDSLKNSTYKPPAEFGFHFQQRIYKYNDISVSFGLQDIVFESDQTENNGILSLNTSLLSAFLVLSSQKDLGDYKFNTYLGFGTGGLASVEPDTINFDNPDYNEDEDTTKTNAGVFVGFLMKTPYFQRRGGMDIVGEFDGTGVNVGLRIPLTSDYRLNLGFTHIERLPNWKTRYWTGHPAFTIGFDMAVPRVGGATRSPSYGPSGQPIPSGGQMPIPGDGSVPAYMDSTIAMADYTVLSLRDSMSMMNNEMRNLMVQLSALEQQSQFLVDSLKQLKLGKNVSDKNMNDAMRHLSRSLRYFYAGDFREALKEVDLSLELKPDLALAYARRGSIYYKLGDVQRATINWNLALRLDPEYDDVRNILKALHENRLKEANLFEE